MSLPQAWTAEDVGAAIPGSRWLQFPASDGRRMAGASIDTRTLAPGEVFFAFGGEHVDGRAFVGEASERGALMAIVEAGSLPETPDGFGVLEVDDCASALTTLARAHRARFGGRVVAVTGSNGKTTTMRLLHAALGASLRGRAPQRSFNNALGVPLTLLGARLDDEYVLCEVGTSAPGEIAELGRIIEPDIAVITTAARAHVAGLGDLKGVAREKASLAGCVRAGGVVVSHGDVTELDAAVREHEGRVRILRFGRSGRSDVRVAGARSERHGVAFEVSGSWNGTCLDGLGGFVPMLGLHNAMNASAAFGAALTLGVDALAALKGMASAEAPAMRLQTRRIGGVTVINDAYNANPDSMLAAIETLAAQRHTGEGRLVAVLGDMLELGPDPASPHLEVAEALAEQGIDLSVLGGESMRAAAERLTERGGACVWLPGFDGEGAKQAAAHIREGDTVLLKGSRKMGVERVEREISARLADEPLAGAR